MVTARARVSGQRWGLGGPLGGGFEAEVVAEQAAVCATDGAQQQHWLAVQVAAPNERVEDAAVADLLRCTLPTQKMHIYSYVWPYITVNTA